MRVGVGDYISTALHNDPINLMDPGGLAPGEPYLTLDDAAMAAMGDIYRPSITKDREFNGELFEKSGWKVLL